MKTKVYWSLITQGPEWLGLNLLALEPERLSSHWSSLFPDKYDEEMLVCHPLQNWMKNAFVLRSPLNLRIFWDTQKQTYAAEIHQETKRHSDTRKNVIIPLHPNASSTIQLHILASHLFFSEKSNTELTLTPPFIHGGPLSRGLQGKYDCGSWFRPLATISLSNKKDEIIVRRGDPIAYACFDRDVKLVQFDTSDEIKKLMHMCTEVKTWKRFTPIRQLYEMFTKQNMRERILTEIKKNII